MPQEPIQRIARRTLQLARKGKTKEDPLRALQKQRTHRVGQGEWKCDYPGCNKAYHFKKNMQRHGAEKHSIRPPQFKCDVPNCDKSYIRNDKLKAHKLRKHSGKLFDPFELIAKIGNQNTPSAGTSKKHHRDDHSNGVSQSTKKTKLERPKKSTHPDRPTRVFKCDFQGCGRSFSRNFGLQRHQVEQHSMVPRIRCTVCRQTFSRIDYMRQNLATLHFHDQDEGRQ